MKKRLISILLAILLLNSVAFARGTAEMADVVRMEFAKVISFDGDQDQYNTLHIGIDEQYQVAACYALFARMEDMRNEKTYTIDSQMHIDFTVSLQKHHLLDEITIVLLDAEVRYAQTVQIIVNLEGEVPQIDVICHEGVKM